MSLYKYELIAGGWTVLIVVLCMFWYALLSKLLQVVKAHLKETRSRQVVNGVSGMFRFVLRAEYMQTGDERLITLCTKLRKQLYAFLGCIGAYIVFLAVMRPMR